MITSNNNKGVFFIAEAGVNHNGSLKIAKKLIDIASKAGADAIKFQTFKTKNLLIKTAPSMLHQKNFNNKISQYEMLKKLEISYDDFKILNKYCKKKKIIFMSTAFDIESLYFLKRINMKTFKVPSSELNNFQYLKVLSSFNANIILSTGMSYLKEVKNSINFLRKNKQNIKKVSLLHCTSQYPAEFKDLNLLAIHTLKKSFNLNVGYSDHSHGIMAPIAAVSMGCKIIEKHFTLSRKMKGPDHKASLEPHELENLIKEIRNLEKSFGDGKKIPRYCELNNRKMARKSIVANKDIKRGEKFSFENITTKRPGTGITADKYFIYIKKKSKKNYKNNQIIKE
jgi:N,N'-diacetyllegionaminate synthase